MYYPNIKIVSSQNLCETKIFYVRADGDEVEITSVVAAVEWKHQAGDIPIAILTVLSGRVQTAAPSIQSAIHCIGGIDVKDECEETRG